MNWKTYKNWLTYGALVATVLLNACKQGEPAQPAQATDVNKLQNIAESMDKSGKPEAEAKKALAQFDALSFEEMEALIDLRYELNARLRVIPQEEAAQLRDFRHLVNRKAYQLYQKPFQQLQSDQADEVLAIAEGKSPSGIPYPARSGRTASDCNASSPLCTPWQGTGSISINNSGTPDNWMTAATYVGERTVQCSATVYQDDCDYLFKYTFSKIWAPGFIKTNMGQLIITDPFASKLIDDSPQWIDCGTYTLEVLYGKGRIDFVYTSPQIAAGNLQLGLVNSIQTGWCYLGAWGSEKWYYAGAYYPQYDGWGRYNSSAGWSTCTCDAYGKKVR